jgi:pSer/pThr/pTyr-binding forkhead associated (FHA) protein
MKIIVSNNAENYHVSTTKLSISIGRDDSNDLRVPFNELSRKHCQLFLQSSEMAILDPGSKNGVFVDGSRIPVNQKFPITPSSTIKLANKYPLRLLSDSVERDIMKSMESSAFLTTQPIPTRTRSLSEAEVRALARANKKLADEALATKIKVGVTATIILVALFYFWNRS